MKLRQTLLLMLAVTPLFSLGGWLLYLFISNVISDVHSYFLKDTAFALLATWVVWAIGYLVMFNINNTHGGKNDG